MGEGGKEKVEERERGSEGGKKRREIGGGSERGIEMGRETGWEREKRGREGGREKRERKGEWRKVNGREGEGVEDEY